MATKKINRPRSHRRALLERCLRQTVLLSIVLIAVALPATAREFAQEAFRCRPDGTPLPTIEINPEAIPQLSRYEFDLGQNRRLSIRTNLPASYSSELDSVAATVSRCYQFLENRSGKSGSYASDQYLSWRNPV